MANRIIFKRWLENNLIASNVSVWEPVYTTDSNKFWIWTWFDVQYFAQLNNWKISSDILPTESMSDYTEVADETAKNNITWMTAWDTVKVLSNWIVYFYNGSQWADINSIDAWTF